MSIETYEFVGNVLKDVPQVEYNTIIYQVLLNASVDMMPEELKPMYKKYPDWFKTVTVNVKGNLYDVVHNSIKDEPIFNEKSFETVKELCKLDNEQRDKITDLKQKLYNIADSCKSWRELRETLPEFAKYIPDGAEDDVRDMDEIKNDRDNLVREFRNAGMQI